MIELPAGNYELTQCGADDSNVRGDLDLATTIPVTLSGAGAVVIRQRCAGERVFDAQAESGLVTFKGVTLTGGNVLAGTASEPAQGGGVRALGDVNLDGATISANSVRGNPGSIGDPIVNGAFAQGGGLYVGGALHAVGSTLSDNTCAAGAGTTADPNTADSAAAGGACEGGGAYVVGEIRWSAGSIKSNTATGGDGDGGGGSARGGALAQAVTSTAAVTLIDTNFAENHARGGNLNARKTAGLATGGAVFAAGALEATRVTATANSAVGGSNAFLDALSQALAGAANGGALAGQSTVSITEGSYDGNTATSGNALFDGNSCGFFGCTGSPPAPARGGAIYSGGALTLVEGTFNANVTRQGNGSSVRFWVEYLPPSSCPPYIAPCPTAIPHAGADVPRLSQGGAAASDGTLSVQRGTYTNNDAAFTPPTSPSNVGGSAGIGAALHSAADATIALAHFSHGSTASNATSAIGAVGNVAMSSSQVSGAGLAVEAGSVDALNSTFTGQALGALNVTANALLRNTTIAGNNPTIEAASLELDHATIQGNYGGPLLQVPALTTHRSVATVGQGPICQTGVVVSSSSYNWFTDASCGLTGAGDHQESTAALLLQPLADNGGPVQTLLPDAASVLVNAVPTSACPVQTDARGTPRPQGSGCDIGAVEAAVVPGTGSTDLKLAMQNPPATVVPGTSPIWTLTLRNAGPSATVPAIVINVPAGVTVSATSSSRCALGNPVICRWTAPFAAGGMETIELTGKVAPELTSDLVWNARVFAQMLSAPLDDDNVTLTTSLAVANGVHVFFLGRGYITDESNHTGPYQDITVYNDGPSVAVGTAARPIRVEFQPVAGISTYPATVAGEFIGTIQPRGYVTLASFGVFASGTPPAQLGTVIFDPGGNTLTGPAQVPVYTSKIDVTGQRTSDVQSAGSPMSFQFTAKNNGAGTEYFVEIELSSGTPLFPSLTLTPSRGTIRPNGDYGVKWDIGTLAPGESVTVEGTAPYLEPVAGSWREPSVYGNALSRPFDFDALGAAIDVTAAPRGTADLRVRDVRIGGTSGNWRAIEVTIINDGPATAIGSSAEPVIITASGAFSGRGLVGQWDCGPDIPYPCRSTSSLAPGQTATVEIVLDKTMINPADTPEVDVFSASLTPDPLLSNNRQTLAWW